MKVNWKKELWEKMCQYEGEFTLAHAENVFKYFDCGECPGRVGDECDICPIKKAETVRTNHLWKMAAERREKEKKMSETIRYGSFGPIVWAVNEHGEATTRYATQDDLDTLPVGPDLTEEEEQEVDDE